MSDVDVTFRPLVCAVKKRNWTVIDVLLNSTSVDFRKRTIGGRTLLATRAQYYGVQVMER